MKELVKSMKAEITQELQAHAQEVREMLNMYHVASNSGGHGVGGGHVGGSGSVINGRLGSVTVGSGNINSYNCGSMNAESASRCSSPIKIKYRSNVNASPFGR